MKFKWPRQWAGEIWEKPKSEWLEAIEQVPPYWREFVKDHLRQWHIRKRLRKQIVYRRSPNARRRLCKCYEFVWDSRSKVYGFKVLNADGTEHRH